MGDVSQCEKCGRISSVTDTRTGVGGSIRRRRHCVCGHAWTTYETREIPDTTVMQQINGVAKRLVKLTGGGV